MENNTRKRRRGKTLSIDEDLLEWLESKDNASNFINEILRERWRKHQIRVEKK
jgi:glycerol-3-phosphate responsive antiterminator